MEKIAFGVYSRIQSYTVATPKPNRVSTVTRIVDIIRFLITDFKNLYSLYSGFAKTFSAPRFVYFFFISLYGQSRSKCIYTALFYVSAFLQHILTP